MEKKIVALIVIVSLILAISILPMGEGIDRTAINDWAATNKHVISSIDRHHFDIGPFWIGKNCRIYKVQVEDQKIFWFRFGLLTTEIEESYD